MISTLTWNVDLTLTLDQDLLVRRLFNWFRFLLFWFLAAKVLNVFLLKLFVAVVIIIFIEFKPDLLDLGFLNFWRLVWRSHTGFGADGRICLLTSLASYCWDRSIWGQIIRLFRRNVEFSLCFGNLRLRRHKGYVETLIIGVVQGFDYLSSQLFRVLHNLVLGWSGLLPGRGIPRRNFIWLCNWWVRYQFKVLGFEYWTLLTLRYDFYSSQALLVRYFLFSGVVLRQIHSFLFEPLFVWWCCLLGYTTFSHMC